MSGRTAQGGLEQSVATPIRTASSNGRGQHELHVFPETATAKLATHQLGRELRDLKTDPNNRILHSHAVAGSQTGWQGQGFPPEVKTKGGLDQKSFP